MIAVAGTDAGTGGRGEDAEVRRGWMIGEGSEEREERKRAEVVTENDLGASEEESRDAIGTGGGFRVCRRQRGRAW
jgi:hypothetical protein